MILFALVQSTVQAVATATPTITPTPVAHAVAQHANSIQDTLNALATKVSPADLLGAVAAVVTALQWLFNKFPILKRLEDRSKEIVNYIISFVLPFLALALASFASGVNTLKLAPFVYLIGQFIYMVVKGFVGKQTPEAPTNL